VLSAASSSCVYTNDATIFAERFKPFKGIPNPIMLTHTDYLDSSSNASKVDARQLIGGAVVCFENAKKILQEIRTNSNNNNNATVYHKYMNVDDQVLSLLKVS